MIELNTIKKGREIGKKGPSQSFIYTKCVDCGKPDWRVLNVKENQPVNIRCLKCAHARRKGEKRGPAHNRLNLVGKKFTRLIVLEFVGVQEDGHRESLWRCKCDCGKEIVTTGNSLTSGNTKSCGCYHKIRTRQLFSIPDEEILISKVLCDYRKRIRQKGLAFKLTRQQIQKLVSSNCYYCGQAPSNNLIQHGRKLTYQGIDRLDNNRGYLPDNVVPCCIVCNKMKKAMSYGEFVSHIERIHEYRKTELKLVKFSNGSGI